MAGDSEVTKHEKALLEIAKQHHKDLPSDKFNSWLFGFYKINADISEELKQQLKQLKESHNDGDV